MGSQHLLQLLFFELCNTIYMVVVATFFSFWIGLFFAIVLILTDKQGMHPCKFIYKSLEVVINIGRSFPFAILMVAMIPITRWIVGTSLGTTATIVPLTVSAAPFIARLIQTGLEEVDLTIIEAATVMGSKTWHMIAKVLLPEAMPSIIAAITLTMINVIGYSAMAGLIGGGGLGQVAIDYGYHRFNTSIMVITIILLILLVQGIQWVGNMCVQRIRRKRGLVS
jgi:D-methionine transport system permease protein